MKKNLDSRERSLVWHNEGVVKMFSLICLEYNIKENLTWPDNDYVENRLLKFLNRKSRTTNRTSFNAKNRSPDPDHKWKSGLPCLYTLVSDSWDSWNPWPLNFLTERTKPRTKLSLTEPKPRIQPFVGIWIGLLPQYIT